MSGRADPLLQDVLAGEHGLVDACGGRVGRGEEAVALRESHEAVAATEQLWMVARQYAWMGDKDKAFEILYDRYWPHMYRFRNVVQDPMWAPLVDDPRWRALLEKSGYTPEALAAVEFDPVLPDY